MNATHWTKQRPHRRGALWLAAAAIAGLLLLWSPIAAQAQSLPNGGSVGGSIVTAQQEVAYTFTASAGEGIQLRTSKLTGTLRPTMSVYGPSGSRITANGGGGCYPTVSGVDFSAPSAGTYTVVVADCNQGQVGTGNFNLYFVRAPGANEGGTPPSGGQATAGTIDLGDLDSYTFTANAGEGIQLRVAKLSGTLRPTMSVYGPSGNRITANGGPSCSATVSGVDFSAPSAGTYTVVVADCNQGQEGTGNYNLYFVRSPGVNELGTLNGGVTRTEQIDIGDLDSYSFTANVGDSMQIRTDRLGISTLRLTFFVYGPSGNLITAGTGSCSTTTSGSAFSAPSTGTYTVVVADCNNGLEGTGAYSIFGLGATGTPPLQPELNGDGDVPLPAWALVLLGVSLVGGLWKKRSSVHI